MLPNKIYAGFDENTHLESYCTEKKGKCQTEYIRKDALVKWFTERKEKREAVAEKSNDDFDRGMAYAYQKTLEKIESL